MLDAQGVARWRQDRARHRARQSQRVGAFDVHHGLAATDSHDVLVTLAPPFREDPIAAVRRLKDHAESRGSQMRVEHVVETVPDLSSHLVRAGFGLTAMEDVLVCHPAQGLARSTVALDVEEVDARSDLEAVRVTLEANERGFDDDAPSPTATDAEAFRAGMGEACAFTARSGGVVVASGMYTQPFASAAEFTGISTLSAYRRQGFGGALVSHMVLSARRRGVTTAILTVSDTGASRVYERAGFASCATLACHEWRASTSER